MPKLRRTTPEEETAFQRLATGIAPEVARLDNGALAVTAFCAMLEMARRDGPAAAAAWAHDQADRVELNATRAAGLMTHTGLATLGILPGGPR